MAAEPKIHVTLRIDQAECIIETLEYVSARFNERMGSSVDHPTRLASRLADARAQDIITLIKTAMEKS